MSASDYVGIATLITAAGAAVVSIVVALRQHDTRNEVAAVHDAVRTSNGDTIGQLIEAGEVRRTSDLPPKPEYR